MPELTRHSSAHAGRDKTLRDRFPVEPRWSDTHCHRPARRRRTWPAGAMPPRQVTTQISYPPGLDNFEAKLGSLLRLAEHLQHWSITLARELRASHLPTAEKNTNEDHITPPATTSNQEDKLTTPAVGQHWFAIPSVATWRLPLPLSRCEALSPQSSVPLPRWEAIPSHVPLGRAIHRDRCRNSSSSTLRSMPASDDNTLPAVSNDDILMKLKCTPYSASPSLDLHVSMYDAVPLSQASLLHWELYKINTTQR